MLSELDCSDWGIRGLLLWLFSETKCFHMCSFLFVTQFWFSHENLSTFPEDFSRTPSNKSGKLRRR